MQEEAARCKASEVTMEHVNTSRKRFLNQMEKEKGHRIQVGGKPGRHPNLGQELKGFYAIEEVPEIVGKCLDHYQQHREYGERFGTIIRKTGTEILDRYMRKNEKNEKNSYWLT